MNRQLRFAAGVLAVLLIPVGLWLAVAWLPPITDRGVALLAPLVGLVVDTVLFWWALGAWPMGTGDRIGIAIVMPLLLAMATWALLVNTVAAQMAAGG